MKRLLAAAIISGILVMGGIAVALGQMDMTEVRSAPFGQAQRPQASFVHDEHNTKAGLEECVVCHHSGSRGAIAPGETSEGTPCAECHRVSPKDGSTSLRQAFHRQCINCHNRAGKGPLACGECHLRK